MAVTARGIIIEDDSLIVLYREKIINGKKISYYAIPGGYVEDGETLEDSCIREIKEELNLDVEVVEYLGGMVEGENEHNYFKCKIVSGVAELGGEEAIRNCPQNYYEIRYLNLNELDSFNILAIDYVKRALKNE